MNDIDSRAKAAADLFGRNMASLIRRRNISFGEFAEIVGVNPGTLTRYHKGENAPNLIYALRICEALDVSLGDMVTKRYGYEYGFKK